MAPRDPHHALTPTWDQPPTGHFEITPHDTNVLPILPTFIYVDTAGTVVLEDANGTALSYTLPDNGYIRFRAVKVLATGTNATTIYGLF